VRRFQRFTPPPVPPERDGLNGDQQFYLAFAQQWASKTDDSDLRDEVLTNTHSPNHWRTLTVRNENPGTLRSQLNSAINSISSQPNGSEFGREMLEDTPQARTRRGSSGRRIGRTKCVDDPRGAILGGRRVEHRGMAPSQSGRCTLDAPPVHGRENTEKGGRGIPIATSRRKCYISGDRPFCPFETHAVLDNRRSGEISFSASQLSK
jgi:hypothetical protein